MKTFYYHLFYFHYKFTLRTPRKEDALFMSVMILILPIQANFLALKTFLNFSISDIYIIKVILEKINFFLGKISVTFDYNTLFSIILSFLIIICNLLIFARKNRYKKIITNIEKEPQQKRNLWKIIVISYLVITIIAFFIAGVP